MRVKSQLVSPVSQAIAVGVESHVVEQGAQPGVAPLHVPDGERGHALKSALSVSDARGAWTG